jgi:hypothetical protein
MRRFAAVALLLVGVVVMASCQEAVAPLPQSETNDVVLGALERRVPNTALLSTPSPLTTVAFGSSTLEMWPYTGTNYSGTPQDPVNLIFVGKSDPRDIRAALLALDGDRDPNIFPPVAPFTSKWTDGIGDVQTAYATGAGWVGSTIQLECGDHSTVRFHVRIFRAGEWTLANAHVEFLIPGTTDHQVLSWEFAEQFLLYDLMRTGLLDSVTPMAPTDAISDSPFRVIPSFVYNLIPDELKVMVGLPPGTAETDVGIPTDGHAMIINLASKEPWKAGVFTQEIVLPYGQVVPKPFCNAGAEYLYVEGPVNLKMTTRMSRGGIYTMTFFAEGNLTVTPVNQMTGEPTAPSLKAYVMQRHSSTCANHKSAIYGMMYQRLGNKTDEGFAYYFSRLSWNNPGSEAYDFIVCCGEDCDVGP